MGTNMSSLIGLALLIVLACLWPPLWYILAVWLALYLIFGDH